MRMVETHKFTHTHPSRFFFFFFFKSELRADTGLGQRILCLSPAGAQRRAAPGAQRGHLPLCSARACVCVCVRVPARRGVCVCVCVPACLSLPACPRASRERRRRRCPLIPALVLVRGRETRKAQPSAPPRQPSPRHGTRRPLARREHIPGR